jgi:hypothetical protein
MIRAGRLSTVAWLVTTVVVMAGGPAVVIAQQTTSLPCGDLGRTLGGHATLNDDGVCRVTLPRGDLDVMLLGAALPTGMGLTSWAAFLPTTGGASMVMGDLALTSHELPEVQRGLEQAGIRITAVHRHMLGEEPTMSFMHYMGLGEPQELALGLRHALARAPSALGDRVTAGGGGTRTGVVAGTSCSRIRRILGGAEQNTDEGPGYCKVSMPRSDLSVRVDGTLVPASMGVGSWFAFRETEDGRAAVIAGDMALTQEQVNPAIAALARRGIDVVALHNHMLFDEPRVMFFHFQERGDPVELAEGLRAGLDAAGLP